MDRSQQYQRSRRFLLISLAANVIFIPPALPFYSPTAIGYVQLPGILLAVSAAIACGASFFLCPRSPLGPKVVTGVLMIPVLFCALDFIAYYVLHLRWHS
jgi:hypothetical protein